MPRWVYRHGRVPNVGDDDARTQLFALSHHSFLFFRNKGVSKKPSKIKNGLPDNLITKPSIAADAASLPADVALLATATSGPPPPPLPPPTD